jgi:hypothetical protein
MSDDRFEQLETSPLEDIPEPDVTGATREERYFQLLATAIGACAQYKPMFGKGRKGGFTLDQFRQLYSADPFYY